MPSKTLRIHAAVASTLLALLTSSAAAAPQVPTAGELMDWAERTYPQLFPGHQPNQTLANYLYRHYPGTGNYVGVAGNGVYILGPVAGGGPNPVQVGVLADFACQVHPASCDSAAPTGENDCHDLTLTRVSQYEARRRTVVGGMNFDVVETRGPLQQASYRSRSLLSYQLRHESTGPSAGDRNTVDDWHYFERSGARAFAYHGQVQEQVSVLAGVTRRTRTEYVWDPAWMDYTAMLSPGQEHTQLVQSTTTQTTDGVTTGPTPGTERYHSRFVGYEILQTAGAGSFPACRFEDSSPDAPGIVSVVWVWRGYGLELEREVRSIVAGQPTVMQRGLLMTLTVNGQRAP